MGAYGWGAVGLMAVWAATACNGSEADKGGDPGNEVPDAVGKQSQVGSTGGTQAAEETPVVDAPGGQTGMEGATGMAGCEAFDSAPPPPTEAEVLALISGTHNATLAHQPHDQATDADPSGAGLFAMELRVEPDGPGTQLTECGGVFDLPVRFSLRIAEPNLELMIGAKVRALSPEFAIVRAELDPDALSPLGLPRPGPNQETFALQVAFTPDGIYGELETGRGRACGVAVFPGGKRCEGFRPDTALDDLTEGVSPRHVLSRLPATFAITWEDGDATELAIAIEAQPVYACGNHLPDDAPRREHHLSIGVLTRVKTADGRLDVELPALLDYEVSTELSEGQRGWNGGYSLVAAGLFPRHLLNDDGPSVPLGQSEAPLIKVELDLFVEADHDELNLWIGEGHAQVDEAPLSSPVDLTALGKQGCFPTEVLIRANNWSTP